MSLGSEAPAALPCPVLSPRALSLPLGTRPAHPTPPAAGQGQEQQLTPSWDPNNGARKMPAHGKQQWKNGGTEVPTDVSNIKHD